MCTEVDCLFVKTQSTCLGTWVGWLLYLCNHLPWANLPAHLTATQSDALGCLGVPFVSESAYCPAVGGVLAFLTEDSSPGSARRQKSQSFHNKLSLVCSL